MARPRPRFHFDFVDPLSYRMERALVRLEAEEGLAVERVGFELRPPPLELLDPEDPGWLGRWEEALDGWEGGEPPTPPPLVPWTRKAHELVAHVEEAGETPDRVADVREAVFRAALVEGRDIGRVDVLVELAVGLGHDLTRTKAVLDVDRHAEAVRTARAEAEEAGVRVVPTLRLGARRLEGFHNEDAIRTFLADPAPADPTE